MADLIGRQLGSYLLTSFIGDGGFAEVYLGKHIHLGSPAAIKVLNSELVDEQVKRFHDEAQAIVLLRHPNIVRLLEFGIIENENRPFLILEYAPNGTLRQRHLISSRLDLPTIAGYVKQIASALEYIHQQKSPLIHLDLKPENLLLGSNNEVLLSDFGIAMSLQQKTHMTAGKFVGTAAYAAPEQFDEDRGAYWSGQRSIRAGSAGLRVAGGRSTLPGRGP